MVEISVIMAVYNAKDEDILKLAVESILNQTYENFELIICDDCSTDGTFEILQKLARKDERIALLRNETNLGAGSARNRCLQISQGKFIAIMDSDDYSSPDRLKKEREFLKANEKYSFVGSKGQYFEHSLGDCKQNYWYFAEPRKKDFLMTLPFVHASLMFRKEVLQKVNGYRTIKMVTRSEDYDMLMRLYSAGYIGANINETLYYIRQDKNTYKKRKYRYRFYECFVKWQGFSHMRLMPQGILYAMKPLVVGLIPTKLLNWLKNKYYN